MRLASLVRILASNHHWLLAFLIDRTNEQQTAEQGDQNDIRTIATDTRI